MLIDVSIKNEYIRDDGHCQESIYEAKNP